MRTIQIQETFKYNSDVFIIVRKLSSIYKLHESYSILDNTQEYLTKAYIRSIKKLKLSEIDNETAVLDKNTSADILQEILKQKGITPTDDLLKIVFSTQRPILDYDR